MANIEVNSCRIATRWAELKQQFPRLSPVMLGILCVVHSIAKSERVFSAVGRVTTSFRSNLGSDTLEGLVRAKNHMKARGQACCEQKLDRDILTRAKYCTKARLHAEKLKN